MEVLVISWHFITIVIGSLVYVFTVLVNWLMVMCHGVICIPKFSYMKLIVSRNF